MAKGEKRKTRLNKGEGGDFIGFGAFAAPGADASADASADATTDATPSESSPSTPLAVPGGNLTLSPVYMGSDAELSLLFPRIGQKRDATTNTKALQDLRAYFASTDHSKKQQVEALQHFLYLYQNKLAYDGTPRVRSASLDCCQQAMRRVPKAWSTLTRSQSELIGMMACARADPATEVRIAAQQILQECDTAMEEDYSTVVVREGIWDYVRRMVSYSKPLAMHQDLFQKSKEAGKLSDRQADALDETFERIVGTALGGLRIFIQLTKKEEEDSVLPHDHGDDVRYLWKTFASPKTTLRQNSYQLLSTCCQNAPFLVQRDKVSKLLAQNLNSEREPTNVRMLLETLLAFVAAAPNGDRTLVLAQYTKPLIKLFGKGCHGATQWAPMVLPIVALLPPDDQATVLTSVWQGHSALVGVADQRQVVAAVAETAAFLLLKAPHDLSEVVAKCWSQALQLYVIVSSSTATANKTSIISGPTGKAHEALGQILAKGLQQLDAARSTHPQSAVAQLDAWFWETELPNILLASEADPTHLTNLLRYLSDTSSTTSISTTNTTNSHLPRLWKQLFDDGLQRCQGSSGLVPGEETYQIWLAILDHVRLQDLFSSADAMQSFLMNDLLRWMIIHTSSLSDQCLESLAKYDFVILRAALTMTSSTLSSWDAILRELVAAKCDLEALVAGLEVLAKPQDGVTVGSLESPILDALCVQVAEEAVQVHHDEENHEDGSDATELHLTFHRKAAHLLQMCVGLGTIPVLLVDHSVISKLIDLACPMPSSQELEPNPVLETLISMVQRGTLEEATFIQRTLLQAWRQGGELWQETVTPWLSAQSTDVASQVVELASKELRSTVRQASSEANVDGHQSQVWSHQAVRLLELCATATSSPLPTPSLEILGLADMTIWMRAEGVNQSFVSTSLMTVMGLIDIKTIRPWSLFANVTTTVTQPVDLLVQVLLGLSDGSTDILQSEGCRQRVDSCAVLLEMLGGKAIDPSLLKVWTRCCITVLSTILKEEATSSERVCRGIAVLSQLLSLGFQSVRPPDGSNDKDKLRSYQVQKGGLVWYIINAEQPSIREQCTVVKVHNDPPSEVYVTIKVERDGVVQERQTVVERLRSGPGLASSDAGVSSKDGHTFVDKIEKEETKERENMVALIMKDLVSPHWDSWRRHDYELLQIVFSQLGLLGPRGIGSTHYTLIQKCLSLEAELIGELDRASAITDTAVDTLWKLSFAFGYGWNVPTSQSGITLVGFEPIGSISTLLRLLYEEANEVAEAPSIEAMRASLAWLVVCLPSIKESEKLDQTKSLLFLLTSRVLDHANAAGQGFQRDDFMALRVIQDARGEIEQDTESDALSAFVKSFSSRWENEKSEASWPSYSICTASLEMCLEDRPRLMGIAARKNVEALTTALFVESKRWPALRLLQAYAVQGVPIHDNPENATNDVTREALEEWSKDLIDEEAEELEEDVEIVCQWVPQRLMNEMEAWQDLAGDASYFPVDDDVYSQMSCWLAYLQIVDVAAGKDTLNRPALTSYTTKCKAVDAVLNLASIYANIGTDRKARLDTVIQLDAMLRGDQDIELSKLAAYLIYRTVEVFPTLAKTWWEMACPNYFREAVRDFVETNVAPEILRRELQRIKVATTFGEMTVKGSAVSREVTALYTQDDFTLTVVIKMPLSFPFRRAEVDCSKTLGVPESRWKRWSLQITQMLNNQGGTLNDALLLWKENVDKEFEGVEPCPVCYSVLHVKTHKLPEMQCKTCQNSFHFDCLTQWFRSSGKSACVICQQPWSGTRVQ